MFNRFTSRALQVLFYARSEVSQLGSSALEPEHLLLGMLDEGKGLGSRMLARTGGTVEDFRSDIVGRVTSREKVPESDEIPFSASCTRVLEYAAEEADRLLHNSIGTEHLLLGLLREERSIAAEVLAARGLRIEEIREAIVKLRCRGSRWRTSSFGRGRGIAGTSTSQLGSATMRGSTSSWCCRSRRPWARASV